MADHPSTTQIFNVAGATAQWLNRWADSSDLLEGHLGIVPIQSRRVAGNLPVVVLAGRWGLVWLVFMLMVSA